MQNIRQYNCLFAFTSMGAHIDRSMNDGHDPPIFKVCGQVHHRIGSLLPMTNEPPKFLQLYVYDTTHEVNNRIQSLSSTDAPASPIRPEIVHELLKMLDEHNPFAKKFRLARERLNEHTNEEFIIRIVGAREGDPVQYNMPTTDDLAMLVIGDFSLDTFKRDIIIETRNSELRRISSLHPAYMALQYPLLFPYGERGFQVGVLYSGLETRETNSRTHMTMQDYYCYQFHYKFGQPNPFLSYGTLSNQAKVDARACIDENRLTYILHNQDRFANRKLAGYIRCC
ncbi:Retrotransposon-like protein [Zea mays]|uniref:Retrotransposon-like protein n=1 Tax=Zea mays TaxID=4577 RepID=A0A1D6PY62_MAIZE|nr:Retrotransposon-like protein [Zea mays]